MLAIISIKETNSYKVGLKAMKTNMRRLKQPKKVDTRWLKYWDALKSSSIPDADVLRNMLKTITMNEHQGSKVIRNNFHTSLEVASK